MSHDFDPRDDTYPRTPSKSGNLVLVVMTISAPWIFALVAGILTSYRPGLGLGLGLQRDQVSLEALLDAFLLCLVGSIMLGSWTWWLQSARGNRTARALGSIRWIFSAYTSLIWSLLAVMVLLCGDQACDIGQGLLVILLAGLVFLLGKMSMRVPMNRLIGFRSKRTLSDERTWLTANRKYGRLLCFSGFVSLLGLLAGPYGPVVALIPPLIVGIAFLIEDITHRPREHQSNRQ